MSLLVSIKPVRAFTVEPWQVITDRIWFATYRTGGGMPRQDWPASGLPTRQARRLRDDREPARRETSAARSSAQPPAPTRRPGPRRQAPRSPGTSSPGPSTAHATATAPPAPNLPPHTIHRTRTPQPRSRTKRRPKPPHHADRVLGLGFRWNGACQQDLLRHEPSLPATVRVPLTQVFYAMRDGRPVSVSQSTQRRRRS
jgi:hypothetical protein